MISIIRTPLDARLQSASTEQIEALLASAQGMLPSPALHAPTSRRTTKGLQEVEIIADFVPVGLTRSYHRVHAVLVTRSSLIHVLYTAQTPDPDTAIFKQIVNSLQIESES